MKKKRIKNTDIAEAYKKNLCNISATCQSFGISRKTFYVWKNEDADLAEKLEEAEESLLDNAESKLYQKIEENDTASLIFYLKTKGKKRGYVEKTEQDISVNPFMELMKSLPDD